ncbi:ATP-binding protein [Nonomuraea monospora]|uniref:ATP-binding protein n=1 Tax=Nonomuraea monospora TaxID=568818 RepID=A0ABN3CA85_9ACTN
MASSPAPATTPRLLVEIMVPGVDSSVPLLRHVLKLALELAGHDNSYAARLVTSELVTNAVEHTFSARSGGVVTLVLTEIGNGMVRIEVMDEGAFTVPRCRIPQMDECSGRGLLLVRDVSVRCGCSDGPFGGHVVWAEVSTSGSASPAADGFSHA